MNEALIGFVSTFSGVGLALLGERYLKKKDDDERRDQLHQELKDELLYVAKTLETRPGDLLKVDIWNSVIHAGELRLIERTEKRELSELYHRLQGFNYEADKFVKRSYNTQSQEDFARDRLFNYGRQLKAEIEGILPRYFA